MKTINRVWGLVALLVLLSPLAAFAQKTQKAQATYHDVQIVVKDLASGQEIGTIRPGGTFTLNEGQKVRLIMTAVGSGRGSYYPETEFSETEPGRGWVRVTRTSKENSSATLETNRPGNSNRNRVETLRYRIVENVDIPNELRQGTVTIRVEPGAASGVGPIAANSTAQDLVSMLYRAILLRDFDASGQPYVDRVANGGYPELVKIADEMARSTESRVQIYERGATREQRLAALYQNLLGVSSGQVDQTQWNNDLSRLSNGRVAEVVADMVRSERFQDYHNLSNERTAIRY